MNIDQYIATSFYLIVQSDRVDGDVFIEETYLRNTAPSFNDLKKAILQTGMPFDIERIYRVNLLLGKIENVTEETAIELWKEYAENDEGDGISECPFADFIRDHVPAKYNCGYRG